MRDEAKMLMLGQLRDQTMEGRRRDAERLRERLSITECTCCVCKRVERERERERTSVCANFLKHPVLLPSFQYSRFVSFVA